MLDVLLVVMPFADSERPVLGVSLLKAAVQRLGFSSEVLYANLDLAERIGSDLYRTISVSLSADALVGEWFFADLVFDDHLPDWREYVSRILPRYPDVMPHIPDLLQARRLRTEVVENCVRTIEASGARVVGFTSTFHQTCAALAVARRLKALSNPPVIIFGGANCEEVMGQALIRTCPWIDYVCTREGDIAFPLFMQCLRDGTRPSIKGILSRGDCEVLSIPDVVQHMDDLPVPDFDDYFERLNSSSLVSSITPSLVIETSRGCWWGEKHHCTFCGLNSATMGFRSKSPERVIAELGQLTRRYSLTRIESVDNILDMKYLRTVFPMILERKLDCDLFYEVKANMRYRDLSVMRRAGVRSIQPGIESFSDEVLNLMRKGCNALQNIRLLRWCGELGIDVIWNIIGGFPGEPSAVYERMARLLPLLVHLAPPTSCGPFRLDRFSPYFDGPQAFGIVNVRPNRSYYYVFPYGERELANLAYFFEFETADGERRSIESMAPVSAEAGRWQMAHLRGTEGVPRLDMQCSDTGVVIIDTRPCAAKGEHQLSGLDARIVLACDDIQSVPRLMRQLDSDELRVRRTLEGLKAEKLVVEMDDRFLSLPVFRNRPFVQAGVESCYVQVAA